MSDKKEKKAAIGVRRWAICVGLPLLMAAVSTVVMYTEKAKYMESENSSSSQIEEKEISGYTYIVDNIEYTEEQLLTSISEPCLASRLINYSDGTSHVEDCYITFSSDRTDLLKEYRNGVFTIVVPRDMTETSDSES